MSPKSSKLCISQLTRNVNKSHIEEIFASYGKIKHVDFPVDRVNLLPRGYAYVEFEAPEDASKAMKYMNNGWVDGKKVQVKMILPIKAPPLPRRRSPLPLRNRPSFRHSPRYRRGSALHRRRPSRSRSRSPLHKKRSTSRSRSRSRSPVRRRRRRSSGGSK